MPDERDFDYGICKIPRKDKDGNDISNDRIGRGGRHRSNGTYSGPVFDLKVVDSDPSIPRTETVYRDRTVIMKKDPSILKMIIADLYDEYGEDVIRWGADKTVAAFRGLWADHKEKKAAERQAKNEVKRNTSRPQEVAPRLKAEQVLREAQGSAKTVVAETISTAVSAQDEFDSAYRQYTIHMTSEEAQKELIDIFILTIMREKKIQKLRHARIEDTAGYIVDGADLVKRLADPTVMKSINNILEHRPNLLDEMQETYLTSLLGRELIVDSRFIPIESSEISNVFAVV